MKFIHIVTGVLPGSAVFRHAPPYLVLNNEHPQLFELLAKALDVVADDPVVYIYIRPVIEHIKGPRHINLQRRGDAAGFPLLLFQQALVQVAQDGDIFGLRVVQVRLVNDAHTAVNHRFFHGFKPIPIAHDQLTQREDKVRFQRQGVIIIRVVHVNIHGIDIIRAGGSNTDHLTVQSLDQGEILALRVTDENIIRGEQKCVGDLALGGEGLAAVMDDQPVFQQEVEVPGHGQVIDRDLLRQLQEGHPYSHVAAAETLALPDVSGLHKPASRIHDKVGVRTAQSGPVLQLDHLQLVRVLLNANIPGTGRHDFAGALVIGLHHGFLHTLFFQFRKTHSETVRQPDAGIAGEAAGGAENEAVGVFEQLPVHHDKVVGQGVDAVVQGLRAGLEQLLRGKGHKNSGAGRGKPPLYLHLIETQGQAAHQPFLWLKVQRHQTAVVLLRDGTGLEHVVVQLFPALRRVHQQERHQEHALIPALEVLQQLLGLLAVGSKV